MGLAKAREEMLRALYDRVPPTGCKGLCHEACGPIAFSETEAAHLRSKYGRLPVLKPGTLECSELTEDKRCAVYADRPMICRLWGAVRSMRCPHGCVPEGGFVEEYVGRALLGCFGSAVVYSWK